MNRSFLLLFPSKSRPLLPGRTISYVLPEAASILNRNSSNLISIALVSIVSILLVIVTLLTIPVYAQENVTDSDMPKFFAIQHADSGSISEININFTLSANMELNNTILTGDKSKLYQLVLNNVSDNTILFSDRPDRIVKSISTSDFIENWSTGVDSFALDAPNTVLVVDEIKGQQDTAIVELFDPIYDIDKNSLKFQVTPDNTTSIELPSEFGQNTLVIDIF